MSKSYFLVKLRKFESAPTVMYCILSFIQENHKSFQLQFTPITRWLFGCGHLQSGYCKIKKRRNSINRKAACMDSRGSFFNLCLKDSLDAARCGPAFENQLSAVCRLSLQKKLTLILQARPDKFPLFQKKNKKDNQKNN